MKTFRIVLLSACLSLFSLFGFSQTVSKKTITIGGLTLNNVYTSAQFTSIMGEPDSIKRESGDGGESIIMSYDRSKFELLANKFIHFDLRKDSDYKLNDIVGVGDPSSEILKLSHFRKEYKRLNATSLIIYLYITDAEWDTSPISFYIYNNVVTRITYTYMDDV